MLRKALVLGLILVLDFSNLSTVRAAGAFFAEEPPATAGSPFSAVVNVQSITVFEDGNRIVRANTVRYFRDGQGRTRTERGDGPNRTITICDPVAGKSYVLRPQGNIAFAMNVQPSSIGAPHRLVTVATPETDDLLPFGLLGLRMGIGAQSTTESSSDTTQLGQKTIVGLTTHGMRLVRTIPVGVLGNEKPIISTLERWVSPALGIPVEITQKSSIGGELTLSLSQVQRAEPDATLFSVPAGYTVQEAGPHPGGAH